MGKKSAPYINLQYISNYDNYLSYEGGVARHRYQIPDEWPDFSKTLVSIIVLEYKNPELTVNCLRSLHASRVRVPYEVILIDNSEDEPPRDYAGMSGINNLVYHKNTQNTGFSKGCNQGADLAKGQLLYFVNNDTLFQESCLEELARILLLDEKAGIAGSKLLYEDNTIQHAGIIFEYLSGSPKHRYRFCFSDIPAVNTPLELQAVTGASMMVRRQLFYKLGKFSEEYLNGYEDIDFCLQAVQAGHKIIYNPRSVLYHLESMSRNRSKYERENKDRFCQKWQARLKHDELDYLDIYDNFLLCYSDNPERIKRHKQLFDLVAYINRNNPEILSCLPLHCLEEYKHFRIQRSARHLFDFFIRTDRCDAANTTYQYLRRKHFYRIKHIRYMRQTLQQKH